MNRNSVWRLPAFRLLTVLFASICLALALLMPVLRVSVDTSSALPHLNALAALSVLFALVALCLRRLETDETLTARRLSFALKGISNFSAFTSAFILLGMAQAIFSYLMVATAMPLQDATLAAVDRAVGLDWVGFLEWTNSSQALARILAWAYQSSIFQIFLVAAVLAFTNAGKMWDFLAQLMICLTVTLAISAVVPAIAPYAYYVPDPQSYHWYAEFGATPGLTFLSDFNALRSGDAFVLAFGRTEGLVSFTSSPPVVALLIPYALRHQPYLFWPAVMLNALVIVSTLPVGGHYLADVFGGAGVALAGVYLLKQWKRIAPLWEPESGFASHQPVQS